MESLRIDYARRLEDLDSKTQKEQEKRDIDYQRKKSRTSEEIQ